jgi:hypothetical protein
LTKVVEHGTHHPKRLDYTLCKFPSQHFNYNTIVDHGGAKNIAKNIARAAKYLGYAFICPPQE